MKNFILPIKEGRITSPFGWRNIGRGNEWHQGVDLASPIAGKKVAVYASADGVVMTKGVLGSYGNRVLLRHYIKGQLYETNYAHLNDIMVNKGDKVKQGQQIGIMGNTGGSFGVHLHFEIHKGIYAPKQPNVIDPMKCVSLDDWKNIKEDDKMLFTVKEAKVAVRDYLEQAVKKGKINSIHLEKFDEGILTTADFEGLKIIISQK